MEGKGSFFILLFIVAFLSLTLAVLAGYVFFVGGSPKTGVEATKQEATKMPAETELGRKKIFEKQLFNLKKSDSKEVAVIKVSAEIVFLKGKDIKKTEAKIETYESEIKEILGTYFLNKTVDEVKQPEAKEKAKKELLKKINEIMTASEKEKNDIVYSIIFDEWFYQ